MARCGCGGERCTCSVVAGPGITVSGNGSPRAPYVVEAVQQPVAVASGTCIALSGDGTAGNPLTAAPVVDPAPGNTLVCGPNGLSAPAVSVASGTCITLSGNGTPGSPLTAAPRISPSPNNMLQCGPDGLLVPPPSAGTVATGCGLAGDGSTGSPIAAAVRAWPYACDITARAGGVFCGPDGQLRSEPRPMVSAAGAANTLTFGGTTVPAGIDVPITTASVVLNNPDLCRPAFVWLNVYADIDFTLPAGGQASWGFGSDDMLRVGNGGASTVFSQHSQLTKPFTSITIPPGGSTTFSIDITMGFGAGGATYTRIQWGILALIISN